jgi:hypothetical protein
MKFSMESRGKAIYTMKYKDGDKEEQICVNGLVDKYQVIREGEQINTNGSHFYGDYYPKPINIKIGTLSCRNKDEHIGMFERSSMLKHGVMKSCT